MSATRANGARARVQIATESNTPGLMDALLAFAEEAPKLTRNADGQVGGRVYKYANLDGVLDAVVPLLVKHQLVWTAGPTFADGRVALKYKLTHVPSGESEEDVMPLMGAQDSQGVGSALTYARRYALLAVLNLAPGDDDDGAAASANQGTNQGTSQGQSSASPGTSQPTAAPPKPSERQLSEPQKRLLSVRSKDLTPVQYANVVATALRVEPPEEADAKRWVEREAGRLPARLVDAVLEGIASCPPF